MLGERGGEERGIEGHWRVTLLEVRMEKERDGFLK